MPGFELAEDVAAGFGWGPGGIFQRPVGCAPVADDRAQPWPGRSRGVRFGAGRFDGPLRRGRSFRRVVRAVSLVWGRRHGGLPALELHSRGHRGPLDAAACQFA